MIVCLLSYAGICTYTHTNLFSAKNCENESGLNEDLLCIKKIIMLFYGKLNSQSVIVCVQPTYYEYSLTKLFMFLFVCYILIETGTGLYKYSYYANNIFVRRIIHISFVWQCLDIIVIQHALVWLFFWSCFMSGQQTFSIYESGFLQAGCPFCHPTAFCWLASGIKAPKVMYAHVEHNFQHA